ncbi:hypothetical protein GC093_10190 [Paenibacillus sp. LMG 31456]|uniref:Uncharacterized protein n=1 Tax=Paenibacillus foliorum TaxID=2654974 RepID=A0A972GTJ7_9BACL|nr:hypothetical protein [Paenibacillus foliorum]NOU93587.1 hypothetical protein [Paenibacillus foliorum]
MLVQSAAKENIASWSDLASEIEFLFDQIVNNPRFHQALEKNIMRTRAVCVRELDGPAGANLSSIELFLWDCSNSHLNGTSFPFFVL